MNGTLHFSILLVPALSDERGITYSDYNFAPDGMGNCIPVGPESIPKGQCRKDGDQFLGSSGFRLIPGNTCDQMRGIKKDTLRMKPCHAGKENPGLVSHQSVSIDFYLILARACTHVDCFLFTVHLPWSRTRSKLLWRFSCEFCLSLTLPSHRLSEVRMRYHRLFSLSQVRTKSGNLRTKVSPGTNPSRTLISSR